MNEFGIVILLIIIGIAIFEAVLYYLHINRFDMQIPDDVANIYHPFSYRRFIKREKKKFVVIVLRLCLQIVFFIYFVVSGLYLDLHSLVETHLSSSVFQTLLYIGAFFFVLFVLEIVIQTIDRFYINKQKTSKKNLTSFLTQMMRKFILWFFITIPLLGIFVMLFNAFGIGIFIITFIGIEVLIVLGSLFFTKLIVLRSYKLTPLEEGELRERIRIFLNQEGYLIDNVYILNQGNRSSELNAFISGFSKRKRIVLFDTLVKRLSYDEIIAVIAHELGHQKHHHIIKNMSLSWILVSVFLGLFYWLLSAPVFYTSFSFPGNHYGFVLIIGYFLFDFVVLLARTLIAIRSRKLEYEADDYVKTVWYKKSLSQALVKIARQNIEHLTPHPLYVLIYYTHPELQDRFKKLLEEDQNES